MLIVRTVWLMDRGFEFTDQSFYLMLSHRPTEYDFVYGLFGYGLHPLYVLMNGDVASMQRAAALILVSMGAAVGLITVRNAKKDWQHFAGPAQIIAVSAASSLIYYLLSALDSDALIQLVTFGRRTRSFRRGASSS